MNSTNVPTSEVNTVASLRVSSIQAIERLTMACLLHEEMDGKKPALNRLIAAFQRLQRQILAALKPPEEK